MFAIDVNRGVLALQLVRGNESKIEPSLVIGAALLLPIVQFLDGTRLRVRRRQRRVAAQLLGKAIDILLEGHDRRGTPAATEVKRQSNGQRFSAGPIRSR